MLKLCGILLVAAITTSGLPLSERCKLVIERSGMSAKFNETVAHSIHSMTVPGLKMFNATATAYNNDVPTINRDLSSATKVLPYAPDDSLGSDFATETMNVMDAIFQHLGDSHYGPQWTSIARAVHEFHMRDLWVKIQQTYWTTVDPSPPSEELCECLTDTANNGIHDALQVAADELYESHDTIFVIFGKPLPDLTSAEIWRDWKEGLLHYYNKGALYDAANYLYCATRDF